MKLKTNPSLVFSNFNDSSIEQSWLCAIPTSDGKYIRITIPGKVKKLIESFNVESDLSTFYKNQNITKEEINSYKKLIDEVLVPKGILLSEKNNFCVPTLTKEKPTHMQMQLPIVKPRVVNFFAASTQFFLSRAFFIVAFILCIYCQINFYVFLAPSHYDLWGLTALEQIKILAIVAFGLFFHELGHAAAAFKYGCKKVELGIGWYICFLVFYAELSEAWKLKRKERVIIDAAGMYFQAIFTGLLIFLYMNENSNVIFYAVTMLNISFIWNLNPFFRMDGYWIASDILGISNLRDSANKELRRIIVKTFTDPPPPEKSQLTTKSKSFLLIYTLLSNTFFLYMIYFIFQKLIHSLYYEIPERLKGLNLNSLTRLNFPELIVLLFSNIFQIMMVCFFTYFIFKAILSCLNWSRVIISLLKSKRT